MSKPAPTLIKQIEASILELRLLHDMIVDCYGYYARAAEELFGAMQIMQGWIDAIKNGEEPSKVIAEIKPIIKNTEK